jgi:NRAMP (natural resistance-associated macrophage protein)-like metal ion transporter
MMIASFNLEGSSSSSAGQVVVVTTADEVVNNQQVPTAEVEASPEHVALLSGWRRHNDIASLAEVNSSVSVPKLDGKWYQKFWAFAGLGFLISVAYMDPGNWATDLSGGAAFGYTLLSIILISNFTAIFLQSLSLKLGIVANRDLAQACRDAYPVWLVYCLWIVMEIAIAATDLAEVIGSAVALNLLFGIPVWSGVLITAVDTLFILVFGTKSFRSLEVIVFLLCALIVGVFAYELAVVKPEWVKVAAGLIPNPEIITNPDTLFNAIGILGATVMPHSLFLHSSIIQTRAYPRTKEGQKMALKYGRWDSGLSLMLAFFVNAAILILAAAAFHYGPNKNVSVANITQAYELLAPALGSRAAKILFGVGLLASGQNSTIIGTLAGQVVMEGFLQIRIKPWLRRLITRSIAIIPAAIVAGVGGNSGAGRLLVLSQVILSFTLIFAVVPLVHFTSSRAKMGSFVNCWFTRIAAILIAILIAGLNAYLIVQSIRFKSFGSAGNA